MLREQENCSVCSTDICELCGYCPECIPTHIWYDNQLRYFLLAQSMNYVIATLHPYYGEHPATIKNDMCKVCGWKVDWDEVFSGVEEIFTNLHIPLEREFFNSGLKIVEVLQFREFQTEML